MKSALVALLFFLPIFTAVASLFISTGDFKKRQGKAFDFLSYLPFEAHHDDKKSPFLVSLAFLALYEFSFLLLPSLLIYFDTGLSGQGFLGYLVGILGVSLLLSAVEFSLDLLGLGHPRLHLGLFLSEGALTAVLSSMELLTVQYFMNVNLLAGGAGVAFTVFFALIALVSVLVMVNPRLKGWDQMKEEVDPSGAVSYVRPRPGVLAVSEWLLRVIRLAGLLLMSVVYALLTLA